MRGNAWRLASVAAAGILTIAAGPAAPPLPETQLRAALVLRPNQQLIRFANTVPCYYVADLPAGKAPAGAINQRWTGSCAYGVASGGGNITGTGSSTPEYMRFGARNPFISTHILGGPSGAHLFPKPGVELITRGYDAMFSMNVFDGIAYSWNRDGKNITISYNASYFNYKDLVRDIESTLEVGGLLCSKNEPRIMGLASLSSREVKLRDETFKKCEKWKARPRETSNGDNFSYVEPEFYLLRIDIRAEHAGTALKAVRLCDGKDPNDPCIALLEQAMALLAPLTAQTNRELKAAIIQYNADTVVRKQRMEALIAAYQAGESKRQTDQQTAVDQQDSAAFNSMGVGELYAHADELNRKGEYERARKAFRALIRRFPNHALATEAAKRL